VKLAYQPLGLRDHQGCKEPEVMLVPMDHKGLMGQLEILEFEVQLDLQGSLEQRDLLVLQEILVLKDNREMVDYKDCLAAPVIQGQLASRASKVSWAHQELLVPLDLRDLRVILVHKDSKVQTASLECKEQVVQWVHPGPTDLMDREDLLETLDHRVQMER